MKTFYIFLLTAWLALTTGSPAKIWRVDSNPGSPGDFATLADAHTAAAAGDTLYVHGSPVGYGDVVITKTLFIFGPGYFLSENPETQANLQSAQVNLITLDPGSEGSLLSGLDIGNSVNINADNITLRRNRISTTSSTDLVEINGSRLNIVVTQNYIENLNSGTTRDAISLDSGSPQNITIANNFIVAQGGKAINMGASAAAIIVQNVISGDLTLNNASFQNNILRDGTFTGLNNDISHNIADSSQFGNTNGNQQNVNMADVFLLTGSTDGQWQLQPGSPAIAAGVNGEDLGMFGGSAPYVLSGLPPLPTIYFFTGAASGTNTGGLPVEVKIRSRQ